MQHLDNTTLLRWNREILAGRASNDTKRKMIQHVKNVERLTGFTPATLEKAYLQAKQELR